MKKVMTFSLLVFFCMLGTDAFPVEVTKNIVWGMGPLVLDHQGNMYMGYDEHTINKYSPTGELLLKIGRKGEGPGDLKRMGSYAFNPLNKTLYVTEFYNGNRRVSRFTTEGKYIDSWSFEFDWTQYKIVSDIAFDGEGNVFLTAQKRKSRRYRDFVVSNEVYDLLKFSSTGKFLKKIYSFNSDFDADKAGNIQITIPFQNALSWTVYRDKIIVKETSGDVIQVFSSDGKLQKKIPLPIKKEPVTEKDIDAWEKKVKSYPSIKKMIAMGKADIDYWRKRLPFPEYKPNSSWRVHTDSKENLYIKKYTRDRKKAPVWFRINLQTGKATTLKFKPGEDFCRIWKGRFYVYKVVEDEDEDVEMITWFTEAELLNRTH